MNQSIFYAWQSDLPGNLHRGFIKEALKRAIKALHKTYDLYEPPRLEESTSSEAGWPDISSTILDQIESCRAFVADISVTNRDCQCRPTPNPNVLFELGYARSTLGHKGIICVINTATLRTGKLEDLPFDIRGKRPLQYHLAPEDDKASVRHSLVNDLEKALAAIFTQTSEGPTAEKWADGDESFLVHYNRRQNGGWSTPIGIPLSWGNLFAMTAKCMLNAADAGTVRKVLGITVRAEYVIDVEIDINPDDVNAILLQFRALGLITKSTPGYWTLTDAGENRLIKLQAIPKKKPSS